MIYKEIISLRDFELVVSYNMRKKKSDWFMISLGSCDEINSI